MINCKPVFILLVVLLFASCTPQRKLIYFQGNIPKVDSTGVKDFEMIISINDLLTFQIYSENPSGLPGLETTIDKQIVDNRTAYEKSLVVDKNGNIDLPLVGLVHVAGLSIFNAKDTLVNRFKTFMDNPVISIKKLSFKVTLLGEFNKPGLFYIPNEKLTFTEALGLGGDLTIFADRTQFKIFRKEGVGYREIPVDLTTTDVLTPEKMFIYPDDVIYVKAIKNKAFANISPAVAVIASIVSSTVLILTLILKF